MIVWGAWCCLGEASGDAPSLFSFEFSTYGHDTILKVCGDGFQHGHPLGCFRVESGRTACTAVLVYVSIRLRECQ
jgi:hypothetical protein